MDKDKYFAISGIKGKVQQAVSGNSKLILIFLL